MHAAPSMRAIGVEQEAGTDESGKKQVGYHGGAVISRSPRESPQHTVGSRPDPESHLPVLATLESPDSCPGNGANVVACHISYLSLAN